MAQSSGGRGSGEQWPGSARLSDGRVGKASRASEAKRENLDFTLHLRERSELISVAKRLRGSRGEKHRRRGGEVGFSAEAVAEICSHPRGLGVGVRGGGMYSGGQAPEFRHLLALDRRSSLLFFPSLCNPVSSCGRGKGRGSGWSGPGQSLKSVRWSQEMSP